ncbi:MAG: mechanosensitive ion channel protein [Rickettsiales bacterium]|nr:MAG: mechanosensitive ion channel protein [Rickettsiales bacterium]
MEELFALKNVYELYTGHRVLVTLFIMLTGFYPMLMIMKKIISPRVDKIIKTRSKNSTRIIEKHRITARLIQVFIAVYLMFWGDILDDLTLMSESLIRIKDSAISIYLVTTISSVLLTAINIGVDLHGSRKTFNHTAIELHTHILKIFITACASLSIISVILGISISSLFTSLGAAAALLTFVFKDTVLGLLASVQLTFQNIIRIGDWVSLPSYGADGDIEKITITVVVIRNFDKTCTTVPTSAFLNTGVKNWRTMFESGGRRIKRAISLDMDTIKICSQEHLDKFRKMPCMTDFAKNNKHMFDAKNETTNITMFRYYVEEYLKSHQDIHQEGFTFLVRQLNPTPTGIPLELYVFTKDTAWANYEAIQASIFDHLLGGLAKFELRAFQTVIR